VTEKVRGDYTVRVSKFDRTTESRPATLQINLTGSEAQNVRAQVKFLDAVNELPIVLGGAPVGPPPGPGPRMAAATVVRGYAGTQIFETTGAGTASVICNVMGGNSVWVTFLPEETGTLFLDTTTSGYNTVMSVLVYSALPGILREVACNDNNGSLTTSAVNAPVTSGVTNFVRIDGLRGAHGTLHLNYSLVTASILVSLGQNPLGQAQIRLTGHPGMHFTIQASSDMVTWLPLITTTSATPTFDFVDLTVPPNTQRFYRALMLP
jgi:hypothetical protein